MSKRRVLKRTNFFFDTFATWGNDSTDRRQLHGRDDARSGVPVLFSQVEPDYGGVQETRKFHFAGTQRIRVHTFSSRLPCHVHGFASADDTASVTVNVRDVDDCIDI